MRYRKRDGTTVMELVVACGVIVAVTAVIAPAARRVDAVRREADRRRRCAAELTNVLTDLSARPPSALPAGPLGGEDVTVRAAFAASVPGAELQIEAVPVEGPAGVETVRLDGALSWVTDAGATAGPVRLSAWAFGPVGAFNTNGEPGADE